MNFFLKASMLIVSFFCIGLAKAEENITVDSAKETALPDTPVIEQSPITLDDAIKKVSQDKEIKVLSAKTEIMNGKKIHIIKVLTATGHIQYIKFDATTGKTLETVKK